MVRIARSSATCTRGSLGVPAIGILRVAQAVAASIPPLARRDLREIGIKIPAFCASNVPKYYQIRGSERLSPTNGLIRRSVRFGAPGGGSRAKGRQPDGDPFG